MNKDELALMIHEKYGTSKSMSRRIVDSVFDEITESLKKGNQVSIFGFGKFDVRKREARKGFSPATNENIIIEEANIPTFDAFKALKDVVNEEE